MKLFKDFFKPETFYNNILLDYKQYVKLSEDNLNEEGIKGYLIGWCLGYFDGCEDITSHNFSIQNLTKDYKVVDMLININNVTFVFTLNVS